jgi:hypothetical protein
MSHNDYELIKGNCDLLSDDLLWDVVMSRRLEKIFLLNQ